MDSLENQTQEPFKNSIFERCCQPFIVLEKYPFSYIIIEKFDCVFIRSIHSDYSGDLVIPNTINDKLVLMLDIKAFSYCDKLTNITIPDSVIPISIVSFENSKQSENERNKNIVLRIESSFKFSNCASLKNVVLPNNILSIDEFAFSDCKSLKSITLPTNVKRIEQFAFVDCKSLESIIIPKSVEYIDELAFDNCNKNLVAIFRLI